MVKTFNERPNRPIAKQSRNKRRAELMQAYRKAALKEFKVEKVDFDNDLIVSKMKKYM